MRRTTEVAYMIEQVWPSRLSLDHQKVDRVRR